MMENTEVVDGLMALDRDGIVFDATFLLLNGDCIVLNAPFGLLDGDGIILNRPMRMRLLEIRELTMQETFLFPLTIGAGTAQVPAHIAAIKIAALTFIVVYSTAKI